MKSKSALSYLLHLLVARVFRLFVLCFNFRGDGLRDAADPYASP